MAKERSTKMPEWADPKGGKEFASAVVEGVEGGHDGLHAHTKVSTPKKTAINLGISDYVKGVLDGKRTVLAQAITLVESNAVKHHEMAQSVLRQLLSYSGKSVRIGITGVPGAGKSTFIETFGSMLCDRGHKVAVLAVDPSSSLTKGSILGDKTRMEKLSSHSNSFIRPSPSGGTLGGVARKTRETMLLCEAAGYDVILVETVGVGQSEATVRSMVDFFLLLTITGAGDELQNIKKGVIELSDAIAINKADGDNLLPAQRQAAEFSQALHYLTPATKGWHTKSCACSALTGEGIEDLWQTVLNFCQNTQASGEFQKRRQAQLLDWVESLVLEQIKSQFYNSPAVQNLLPEIQEQVLAGHLPATLAAQKLLKAFSS